jgi:hypothetical protein
MKYFLLISTVLVLLVGCGPKTQVEVAQDFVNALIHGDEGMLNQLNKSGPLEFPTQFLMEDRAPKFADKNIVDFTFKGDPQSGTVSYQYKDGQPSGKLKI